ncbi:MAG TPA: PQQ-dependent sugar dehydrogenase [Candidatus Acidoferrum sp.]|nr:PQQ-dependent sugar dehydrogenase [Candidatus Acidoferrum sp.]
MTARATLFSQYSPLCVIFLLSVISLVGCGGSLSSSPTPPPTPPPVPATFDLIPVASGFSNPLDVQQPKDSSGRLFVVEQGGHIQIIESDGTRAGSPFLDVSTRTGFTSGGETGLLGMAFHPLYAQNRRFFVNYTRTISGQLQSVIAEFTASSSDPNFADANGENILFTVNQPFSNHKGGGLAFASDGFLYISLGDGGSGGDPNCNGQNINVLLGKILRIDVDAPHSAGLNYAIPATNPFVGQNARGEIWLYGLRNPFRFSFDTANGNLWIGDVGQNAYEEVDMLTPQQGGANLGWNLREGTHPFSTACTQTGNSLTDPVFDYDRSEGDETVIGGHVYHGSKAPALVGIYVFGDFISGRIWSLQQSGQTFSRSNVTTTSGGDLAAIGEDQSGELYAVRYSSGVIARIHQTGQP